MMTCGSKAVLFCGSFTFLFLLIVKLSLSHWYPGSGVVLDCIDS